VSAAVRHCGITLCSQPFVLTYKHELKTRNVRRLVTRRRRVSSRYIAALACIRIGEDTNAHYAKFTCWFFPSSAFHLTLRVVSDAQVTKPGTQPPAAQSTPSGNLKLLTSRRSNGLKAPGEVWMATSLSTSLTRSRNGNGRRDAKGGLGRMRVSRIDSISRETLGQTSVTSVQSQAKSLPIIFSLSQRLVGGRTAFVSTAT
jgi:hypothetical protein